MYRPFLYLPALVCCALALSACGKEEQSVSDSVRVSRSQAPAPPPAPGDSACPSDGTWRACGLEERIYRAGLAVSVKDTVRVPYFSEPGVRYAIGRVSTVVAFFFPDSATGVRETASLDQLTLSPPGDSLGAWPGVPAEVVRSVNLVAVLFDVTDRQAERLRLAITAGAPQPHTVAAP